MFLSKRFQGWHLFLLLMLLLVSVGKLLLTGLEVRAVSPSIYYGVYESGWLNTLTRITSFERDAGKPVSMIMDGQGWGLTDGAQYFEPLWMNTIRQHGSIPVVEWGSWLYSAGVNQPTYALSRIINGSFDSYITRWAQDVKAWGHPLFICFDVEMNGAWYPWSEKVNGNKAGQFVQAWRHVHDLFTAEGVSNVSWVWSPNVENGNANPLTGLYPGDAYVDWVGMIGYNWGSVRPDLGWKTFAQVFGQTYADLGKLAPTKPLMIVETGSSEEGGSKAEWLTDAFSTQLPEAFPLIHAVVWFNEPDQGEDWRIESSKTAQAAFAQAIASDTYATNAYATLNTSPIPVP